MKDEVNQRISGRNPAKPSWSKWLTTQLLRVLASTALLAALLLALRAGWHWQKRLFLSANPHFTVRNIEVRGECGDAGRAEVAAALAALGIRKDVSNLFAIDPARLQRQLTAAAATGRASGPVMVAEAQVARRLPDTLEITVSERVPRARLATGALVDADGWILLPRRGEDPTRLPGIVAPEAARFPPGSRASGEAITPALDFLRLVATRPSGRSLDVWNVMLAPNRRCLVVILHAKGTFREGARLHLPLEPAEMDLALERVGGIALDRLAGQQPTGFIDATYKRNVPVRP
ncbi:MAG: FtsQ-type POTRA domain-containing protein [Lentisphaeria bacterium]